MYFDLVCSFKFNHVGVFLYLSHCSAVAIIETVIFSVLPNSFYAFAIDFTIGKCKPTCIALSSSPAS